ncbi:MAG TPA: RdgB/HAM1 family non-canonical purine NTP pyrophosphatase [Acidimicrobiales bacterium]|nr:RdgB/HAM1 family non-canonical purine NTP pyrophosphatase [Acidimicrobiales bacterium]
MSADRPDRGSAVQPGRPARLARLVLATANPSKAAEIRAALSGVDLQARPASVPEVEETEATLEGNATLKARALRDATGEAALADDTGLEIVALGGAPGVYSARWAGPEATYADNVAKLLREMEGRADRRARFRSVLTIAYPDGSELSVEGTVEGLITTEARGGSGFGYDPVFAPEGGGGRTFAEMDMAEKNSISHRGRALAALADQLGITNP